MRELGCGDQLEAIDASGASIWLRGALDELPTGLVLGIPTSSGQLKSVRGLSWRARLRRPARRARAGSHEDRRRRHDRRHRAHQTRSRALLPVRRTDVGRHPGRPHRRPLGQVRLPRVVGRRAKGRIAHACDSSQRPVDAGTDARRRPTPARSSTHSSRASGHFRSSSRDNCAQRGVVLRTGVAVTALRRTPSGNYPWEVDTPATTTPADAVVHGDTGTGDRATARGARPGAREVSTACAAPAPR